MSYGQIFLNFATVTSQVAYSGAWGLTATLPDKEGEQQYHRRTDSFLKLFLKDFGPEFRRNFIQYPGSVKCGTQKWTVLDPHFRHSDKVTLNSVRRQFEAAWQVWTNCDESKLQVHLISIGAGTSWVHDIVDAI